MKVSLNIHRAISRYNHRIYSRSVYGAWVKDASIPSLKPDQPTMSVFGGYAEDYDKYRPFYPETMWDDIEALVNEKNISTDDKIAIDIGSGTGRGGVMLVQQGFATTLVDLDPLMLKQAAEAAHQQGHEISVHCAPAENTGLPSTSASVIVSLQAFHWFDAPKALAEFHRLLRPNGVVFLGWNDRDLSVQWMADLESLFETYNPSYNRNLRLAEVVMENGDVLTGTNHFKLTNTKQYHHSTNGMTADSLLHLIRTFSYVRNSIEADSQASAAFEKDVRVLVEKHHGNSEFELPYICKTFTLEPN
jgi:SAM-dependent methyltransferase